jgi:hypothetical protein
VNCRRWVTQTFGTILEANKSGSMLVYQLKLTTNIDSKSRGLIANSISDLFKTMKVVGTCLTQLVRY